MNENPLWVVGSSMDKNNLSAKKPLWIKASALKLSTVLQKLTNIENAQNVVSLNYSEVTVKYIVEYLNHHNGHKLEDVAFPLRSSDLRLVCADTYDALLMERVVKRGKTVLYELCAAAEDLQIESLWSLCCCKIAALIKGKPVSKLKQLLTQ